MTGHIKDLRLSRIIVNLWRRIFPAVSETPVAPGAPAAPKLLPPEDSGEFYFREAILDQLDYYMKCLARMRRADLDSYQLYSELGGNVLPEGALSWFAKVGAFKDEIDLPLDATLSPWFRDTMPSFGAIFVGKVARDIEAKEKAWVPRFFYFRKYDRRLAPPEIQRAANGAVYVVTVFWDDLEGRWNKQRKSGVPQDFPVVVGPDGSVKVLRILVQDNTSIRHKQGKDRGKKFTIPRRKWVAADPWFELWAKEYGAATEKYLTALFVQLANTYEIANASMVRIAASKGDLTAAFGVNIKRTPYFFKDREVNLTDSGKRRRIFHIVRPHVRKNGSAVKMHFRGERSFEWNGYRIHVTVPGRDHENLAEFSVGMGDEIKIKEPSVGMKEIARGWRQHMNGKPLRDAFKSLSGPH